MWTHLTREHVSTVFRSIADDFRPRELGGVSDQINKCLSFCKIQFQVAFLDAAADCVAWQWFSKVLPSPCGYIQHVGFSNNTAWGLDGHGDSAAVSALAFTHQDFPWIFSRYYELWRVKCLNYLQLFAKRHCLWTDWQFSHKVWHKHIFRKCPIFNGNGVCK